MKTALIGIPNCGKSSLFNYLTGLNQKTGNFPGVTVEKKKGYVNNIEVIDLPGMNQLPPTTLDEQVSLSELTNKDEPLDGVIFVANGVQLQQSLMLFSQIADLGLPSVYVINFKDELDKNKLTIDQSALEDQLGCPVIFTNSRKGHGIDHLKERIQANDFSIPHSFIRSSYDTWDESGHLENTYSKKIMAIASDLTPADEEAFELDIFSRQKIISGIMDKVTNFSRQHEYFRKTRLLDNILLHPAWGTLIFLVVLFSIFQSIYDMAQWPMELMDGLFGYFSEQARTAFGDRWYGQLLAEGIIPGMGGVLIFIPQIAILFFFIGILESTGYMSRISFLSDKLMRRFGLSGSSVIPLMSGIACAIPAIMSTRTISNHKERLVAIFVTPFMTCSARLPVYIILIGLIFPSNIKLGPFNVQGLVLFGLYMIGLIAALLMAWLVSRFILVQNKQTWIIELPKYRLPNWNNIFLLLYTKTKSFVLEAGKIIFIISIILWFLTSYSPHKKAFFEQNETELSMAISDSEKLASESQAYRLQYSYAGYLGRSIEPVLTPLGYDWKIGIALITSFAAREVFVGSIATIYSIGSEDDATIIQRLRNEKIHGTDQPRFNLATAFSLLLFYAFAMQCMSTLAVVKKETNSWKWPVIQFFTMTGIAYVVALVAYQAMQ